MTVRRSRRRQRGAALLTAMVIVTLVVTMASAMVWQQWRAVQVEIGERARAQAAWILSGALDWAKLILRENQRSNAGFDHLGQPWAVPLAESRLSTFLAADKDATSDDGPEAFLSGAITDAQGKFNLTNLVSNGKVDPVEYAALTRLCESLGLDAQVAVRIASGLQSAMAQGTASNTTATSTPPANAAPAGSTGSTAASNGTGGTAASNGSGGAGDATLPPVSLPETSGPAPLVPASVSQLAWLGLDARTVATLRPYVVILPAATKTNVNTASREVLAAEYDIDLGSAERLVQYRQRTPFKTTDDFAAQLPTKPGASSRSAVGSSFFEVRGRLRLNDRALEERSLLQRQANGQVTVVDTERSSAYDEQPGS